MDFDKLVEALSPEEVLTLFRSLRARLDSKAVNSDELELARTNKINAIRAYRARTGSTLKDGKEAVEAAMSEAEIAVSPSSASFNPHPMDSLLTDDEMYVARTNKLSAIKMFRNRTGQNITTCKLAVETALDRARA